MEGTQQGQITNSSGSAPDDQKDTVEGTTADIDKKVARILDLIKNVSQGRKRGSRSSRRESELVALVEDFHEQYRSLHMLYEHLKHVSGINSNEATKRSYFEPPSPAHSDSEYFSSEEVEDEVGFTEEMIDLKNLLASVTKERDALNVEYNAALKKLEESDAVIKDLKIEADEMKRELTLLSKQNQNAGIEAFAKMKELKSESESLQRNNRQLAAKLEKKATKAKQFKEENSGLKARALELELISKNKANEVSELTKLLRDVEDEAQKVAELTAQVNELQQEVDSLHVHKCEMEVGMENLRNEQMAREKDFMHRVEILQDQKSELIYQLEENNSEISEKLIQIETLNKELTRRSGEEHRKSEECKCLARQVKDLKLKVDKLRERLQAKTDENNRLREEKEILSAKTNELERSLAEKADEIFALQDKIRADGEAYSTHVTGLKIEVENLQQELDSMWAQRSRLESNHKREEKESSRRVSLLESENIQLTNTIRDLQSRMNEQSGNIGKLSRNMQAVKNSTRNSRFDQLSVERKVEELAEEYRKNFEDNIRILCQRILVLEQLHIETKDSYKTAKERFLEEYRVLEEKVGMYKTELKKIMESSMAAKDAMIDLDSVVRKNDENNKHMLNRISKLSKEIQLAVQMKSETNRPVVDREELEKLEKLEKKVEELEGLLKERDEGLLVLGEEKREAIRQLCLHVDYQRSRCDYYKEAISKIAPLGGRRQRQS